MELPDKRRLALADRVKKAADVHLPKLSTWNYNACPKHDRPTPECEFQECGGDLWATQRTGIAWLYFRMGGILGDDTGTGKSNIIIGLCALLKDKGELTHRAIIVTRNESLSQWHQEFGRFAPGLNVIAAVGPRKERLARYRTNFDVCVIGFQMFIKDIEPLMFLSPFELLAADDVDPLLKLDNVTARAFNRLAKQSSRVIPINATNIQTHLRQFYATSVSVGGIDLFGTEQAFERRHILTDTVMDLGTNGRIRRKKVEIGYKNMAEAKRKADQLIIQRHVEDLHDVNIPSILPPKTVWLEPTDRQKAKYDELREGVLKIMTEEGQRVLHAKAWAKWMYGGQICSSLCALGEPDGPEASAKLNWLEAMLEDQWEDKKVIVFAQFRGTCDALVKRQQKKGLTTALVWGTEMDSAKNAAYKDSQVKKFWRDPNCQVLIGTMAMTRSLNLQVSNIVVNLGSTMLNPATVKQLVGRSRRGGSKHSHIVVANVLCKGTQEEHYPEVLKRRQAIADYMAGEESELFEKLTPFEMLNFIRE